MRYLLRIPARFVAAVFYTIVMLIMSIMVLITDLIWNLRIRWWKRDLCFLDREFWIWDLNNEEIQFSSDLQQFYYGKTNYRYKQFATPFHWVVSKSLTDE